MAERRIQTGATRARSGELRRVVATLAAAAALFAAGSAHTQHTVEPGETLSEIAQRHGTTVSALRAENDIADADRLVMGTTISVPDGDDASHHVVRAGESLSAIAERYGVSTTQLADWNGLESADAVWAGTRLSVSGPAAHDVATTGGASHHVARGETLSAIAKRAGVSIEELARANEIADPDRIIAGTDLTIPGGWHCPVRDTVSFVNDFGIPKPSGRFHDGVDLFAPRGTPVVAPVSGRVAHIRGTRGGLQFRLTGIDGHVYIGTHMDGFGASGQVQAGEVLGTVGTTGNARGTEPHLHFEVHTDGERVTNPYPSLRSACG